MFAFAMLHIVILLRATDSGGLHTHAGGKIRRAQ